MEVKTEVFYRLLHLLNGQAKASSLIWHYYMGCQRPLVHHHPDPQWELCPVSSGHVCEFVLVYQKDPESIHLSLLCLRYCFEQLTC